MLKEVVVIVWAEERLYWIWNLECSKGNVLYGIRKKLWTTAFCTRKSIVISEASTNGIEANVLTMLEEVVVIVFSRRTTWFHLNSGVYQWKRTFRNPQKIVNNSLLDQ